MHAQRKKEDALIPNAAAANIKKTCGDFLFLQQRSRFESKEGPVKRIWHSSCLGEGV